MVYRQSYHSIHAYILLVQGCTRLGGLYIYLGEVNIIPIKVVPISVDKVESDVIKIRGGGATLPRLQQKAQTFWEGLYQGGGTWMWDYMLDVTSEPSWLPLALERGTAVLATNGSYNRKRGPNVSGAGWVIACWRSSNILKGSFFEFSSNASSYRKELLGLVAIHTLIFHACWFYQPTTVTGKIICNSKLAHTNQARRVTEGSALGQLRLTCSKLFDQSIKKCQGQTSTMNGRRATKTPSSPGIS